MSEISVFIAFNCCPFKQLISMKKSWETVVGNADLVREILVRLPAKPLLKFKCVSKQWLFLISDPQFCHSHTLHHHSKHSVPSALLLTNGYQDSPHFQVVPLKLTDYDEIQSSQSPSSSSSTCTVTIPSLDYFNVSQVRILQSCNGLLLCSSGFINSDGDGHRYFVCNPTTREFSSLPTFPEHMSKSSISGRTAFTLAFDPFHSPTFKVVSVRFTFSVTEVTSGVCVYSSETNSWHDTGIVLNDFDGMGRPGVYCKGMIHWCGSSENNWSFDVERKSLRRLPMPWSPEHPLEHRAIGYFGESKGHLYMIINPTSSEFNILEISDDYSEWSIKYHVDLHLMHTAMPELRWSWSKSRVCVIQEDDEEQELRVLLCQQGKAPVLLDHKKQTFRKLRDLEPCLKKEPESSYQFQVFHYFQILSCVR